METIQAKLDVYDIVTNRIIQQLEKGTVPWLKPWTEAGIPMNLLSKKPYRGINVWLLGLCEYSQNLFLTYRQAKMLCGNVKRGEKGHMVIFWKWVDRRNKETGEKERIPYLRYYTVYNISQCECLPPSMIPVISRPNKPMDECDRIVANMPQRPEIRHDRKNPFYNVEEDYVNIPDMIMFRDSENYYVTLFHELVHSTGHQSRLDRQSLTGKYTFSSEAYSFEELVAEIGASYLSSLTGIRDKLLDQSAAYIESWLKRLRKDKRIIVTASGHAQKATDYILNAASNPNLHD